MLFRAPTGPRVSPAPFFRSPSLGATYARLSPSSHPGHPPLRAASPGFGHLRARARASLRSRLERRDTSNAGRPEAAASMAHAAADPGQRDTFSASSGRIERRTRPPPPSLERRNGSSLGVAQIRWTGRTVIIVKDCASAAMEVSSFPSRPSVPARSSPSEPCRKLASSPCWLPSALSYGRFAVRENGASRHSRNSAGIGCRRRPVRDELVDGESVTRRRETAGRLALSAGSVSYADLNHAPPATCRAR